MVVAAAAGHCTEVVGVACWKENKEQRDIMLQTSGTFFFF